jgi:hypothetical protein
MHNFFPSLLRPRTSTRGKENAYASSVSCNNFYSSNFQWTSLRGLHRMLVAASKHLSELLTIQSSHMRGRKTWRSGWRTWGCLSSLGPPPIYCLRKHLIHLWSVTGKDCGKTYFSIILTSRCAVRADWRVGSEWKRHRVLWEMLSAGCRPA